MLAFFDTNDGGCYQVLHQNFSKEGETVDNVRCKCGKIVCQLQEQVVLIKCRHCKRFVVLEFCKPEEQERASSPGVKRPKIEYR